MLPAARVQAVPPLDAHNLGLEARTGPDDHLSLKLWLRLLACSTDIETEIRRRLRAGHRMTLARFDYLAQLARQPEGLRMSELSRCLMVTGGNVTGLTAELEKAGWVRRDAEPDDRRSWRVTLTPEGRAVFDAVAAEHERWVVELLGGIGHDERRQLFQLLGRLRARLSARRRPPEQAAS